MNPLKTIKLDFCVLNFYDTFVISEVNEGVNVSKEHIAKAHQTIVDFFGSNTYYGYISLRINDYNVDPTDYLSCPFYDHITGMAIVSDKAIKRETANFERAFFKKSLEVFYTVEEAVNWIMTLPTENLNKKADL